MPVTFSDKEVRVYPVRMPDSPLHELPISFCVFSDAQRSDHSISIPVYLYICSKPITFRQSVLYTMLCYWPTMPRPFYVLPFELQSP